MSLFTRGAASVPRVCAATRQRSNYFFSSTTLSHSSNDREQNTYRYGKYGSIAVGATLATGLMWAKQRPLALAEEDTNAALAEETLRQDFESSYAYESAHTKREAIPIQTKEEEKKAEPIKPLQSVRDLISSTKKEPLKIEEMPSLSKGTDFKDELEVYEKWRKYIDGLVEERVDEVQSLFLEKIEEIDKQMDDAVYERVLQEKKLLEKDHHTLLEAEKRRLKKEHDSAMAEKNLKMTKMVREKTAEMQRDVQKILNRERAALRDKFQRLQEEHDNVVKGLVESITVRGESNVDQLKELMLRVARAENDRGAMAGTLEARNRDVLLCAHTLRLLLEISQGRPFHLTLEHAISAAEGDEFIVQLLRTIPKKVAEHGVKSVRQLQDSFDEAADRAFQAWLVGDHPSVISYLRAKMVGLFLHRLSKKNAEGDNAEARIARAEMAVETGDITGALHELSGLNGLPREAMQGWVRDAQSTLYLGYVVEVIALHVQSLELVSAHRY